MPWIPADSHSIRIDDEEAQMFKDPAGLLPLSDKQKVCAYTQCPHSFHLFSSVVFD